MDREGSALSFLDKDSTDPGGIEGLGDGESGARTLNQLHATLGSSTAALPRALSQMAS